MKLYLRKKKIKSQIPQKEGLVWKFGYIHDHNNMELKNCFQNKFADIFLLFALFFTLIGEASAEPYKPLDHMWYGMRDTPNTENYIIFGIGSLATVASILWFNKPVNDYFVQNSNYENNDHFGNKFWGTIIPGSIISLGLIGGGLIWNSPHEVDSGEATIEGLVATGIYTQLIKLISNEPRPNGADNLSFPSGHSSISFSLSASLMDMYGPFAGVPALILATLTAVSRLAANTHWLSDIVFGATMGYVVGHAYTIHHQGQKSENEVTVMPYFDTEKDFGLIVKLDF